MAPLPIAAVSVRDYLRVQNHPIILELFRRHGKELNFAGVLVTVTSVEARHRALVSKMAANIL